MIPERQGQRWTPEEDEALLEAYRAGSSIEDLAKRHQRSPGAIHSRLIRLGEIESETKPVIVANNGTLRGWTYLILSERGEVYLGATTHLKKRFREHNSPKNRGWTRGRRWHLLAARRFATGKEAFAFESKLKKDRHQRANWQLQCIGRADKIVARYGYGFSPTKVWAKRSRTNTSTSEGGQESGLEDG